MGLFDVNIKRKVKKADKTEVFSYFKNSLKDFSKQSVVTNKESLTLKKFKVKNSFLKYNLTVSVDKSEILLEGELQDVWMIVILIVLGILLTYGIGVIVIVAFVYYQKVIAARYFNTLIDKLQQTVS